MTPTYHSWSSMKTRCNNAKRDNAARYIGRGITYCDRWEKFDNFLADMGERPEGTTLDRYPNPDGNYEPGNCRWATDVQQARNKSNAKLNLESAVEMMICVLSGERIATVARRYKVSESHPREILDGRAWSGVLTRAKEEMHKRGIPEAVRRGVLIGESHQNSKLTDAQRKEICRRANDGENQRDLGKKFGVSQSVVSHLKAYCGHPIAEAGK